MNAFPKIDLLVTTAAEAIKARCGIRSRDPVNTQIARAAVIASSWPPFDPLAARMRPFRANAVDLGRSLDPQSRDGKPDNQTGGPHG